jgi:hypothetical protein
MKVYSIRFSISTAVTISVCEESEEEAIALAKEELIDSFKLTEHDISDINIEEE